MDKLKNMNEIQAKRCEKCDYLNITIPMNIKKSNCKDELSCEMVAYNARLINRIKYIKGEVSATHFSINGKHEIDDYRLFDD